MHHDGSGILAGLPDPFTATRYHSLAVEEASLPAEWIVTARTASGVVMAMRHRDLDVEGVQFHPESILTQGGHLMLANWLVRCGSTDAMERLAVGGRAALARYRYGLEVDGDVVGDAVRRRRALSGARSASRWWLAWWSASVVGDGATATTRLIVLPAGAEPSGVWSSTVPGVRVAGPRIGAHREAQLFELRLGHRQLKVADVGHAWSCRWRSPG